MKYALLALSTLIVGSFSLSLPALAETLIQNQGRLDSRDEQLGDGSFYEVYTFDGQARQQVSIQLTSSDFDTYLILSDPDGQKIAENDDAPNSTNSAITVTLPSSGPYSAIANGYDSTSVGVYRITISANDTTAAVPTPPTTAQSPSSSATNCTEAISGVEDALAEGGYYVPWDTGLPYRPRVTPAVFLKDDLISSSFYGYPPERLQSVTFRLTGDSTRLYNGIMNSPQLLTSYTSQIMDACTQVGLVQFQHWWEGVVPVGYFSDGSIRQFEWIDIEPAEDSAPSGLRVRTVQTSDGPRALYPWGYYYSP